MNIATMNSLNSVSTSSKRKKVTERAVNWSEEETRVLIRAWSEDSVQRSLSESLRNTHVFKHLAARMTQMGFARTAHQCRLRVKTLKANYVKAKLQSGVDGKQPSSFRYYAEMDAVLGRCAANSQLFQLKYDIKREEENGESSDEFELSNNSFSQNESRESPSASVEPPNFTMPSTEPAEDETPPKVSTPVQHHQSCTRHSLEPVIKYMADCFQSFVTESRQFMLHLENQRQEQARWQQELQRRWLEYEEQRQREAAEREARLERARMEHEFRVLQLLTSFHKTTECQCSHRSTTPPPRP
uniref:Myb/SANT-like DNA-binding domain-containing protein n=1 Tax=Lepisosteus oculatus TaxID=7918 RepID=W5MJQ2_LEPOC